MIRFFGKKGRENPTKVVETREESPPLVAAHARIAAADSVEGVIAAIRDTARAVVGSDGITVVRREGDDMHYVTEDAVTPLWAGQRFPMRICISGMAIQARAPIVIPDIMTDSRVPLNAYLATFVKSMAMVPVGRDEPTMAIGAYWQTAHPIAPIAVERLTQIADAAAEALLRIEGAPEPGRQVA